MNIEKRIYRRIGQAIGDFKLIEEGDHIAVGLSGGKDSWILLYALNELSKRAPVNYSVEAVHIKSSIYNLKLEEIENYCQKLGIKLHIYESDIDTIIAENIKKESYCAFCARMRRGYLYRFANENGFNKIALGHHREDFNETLLMSMFFNGQIKSMAVKLLSDDKKNIVIRPMVYLEEKTIQKFADNLQLPSMQKTCPYEQQSERKEIKELLNQLEKKYPEIKSSLISSQKRIIKSHLIGFNIIHERVNVLPSKINK